MASSPLQPEKKWACFGCKDRADGTIYVHLTGKPDLVFNRKDFCSWECMEQWFRGATAEELAKWEVGCHGCSTPLPLIATVWVGGRPVHNFICGLSSLLGSL
jgi:hypothetical protein